MSGQWTLVISTRSSSPTLTVAVLDTIDLNTVYGWYDSSSFILLWSFFQNCCLSVSQMKPLYSLYQCTCWKSFQKVSNPTDFGSMAQTLYCYSKNGNSNTAVSQRGSRILFYVEIAYTQCSATLHIHIIIPWSCSSYLWPTFISWSLNNLESSPIPLLIIHTVVAMSFHSC